MLRYNIKRSLSACPIRAAIRPLTLQSNRPQTRTMSLMQRSSGSGLPSLLHTLHQLDNLMANRPMGTGMLAYSPRFDVRETGDKYYLDGELPGVEKKDIDIEFSDPNTLSIKGHTEHSTSSEGSEGSLWYSERSVGDFKRSFNFPTPVEQDHVDASLKNGVLSIVVPKSTQASTARRIDVK